MDFYPLDALEPKELRSDLRRQEYTLCYDVLEFDPAVEAAVRYAVGNTVVAEHLTAARSLAYERRIRERIVTLEGDEISKSGAMSGGVGEGVPRAGEEVAAYRTQRRSGAWCGERDRGTTRQAAVRASMSREA